MVRHSTERTNDNLDFTSFRILFDINSHFQCTEFSAPDKQNCLSIQNIWSKNCHCYRIIPVLEVPSIATDFDNSSVIITLYIFFPSYTYSFFGIACKLVELFNSFSFLIAQLMTGVNNHQTWILQMQLITKHRCTNSVYIEVKNLKIWIEKGIWNTVKILVMHLNF